MAKQAQRSETTRKAVVSAARELFGGHGFHASTMEGIAEAIGCTWGKNGRYGWAKSVVNLIRAPSLDSTGARRYARGVFVSGSFDARLGETADLQQR